MDRCISCGKETDKRCGACKQLFFCSTTCQSLIWPSHKYICKKELTTFYFPPLTEEEATFLKENLRNVPVGGRLAMMDHNFAGKTLEKYLEFLGFYKGSFNELVNRLTVGSENPMNEPFFTANAIIARYHLNSPMRTGPHYEPPTKAGKTLGMFSLGANDLIGANNVVEHRFFEKDDPRQTFKAMNDWYRSLLYYSCQLRHNRDTPRMVPKEKVVPALDRMLAIETRQMEPNVRQFAEALKMTASSIFKT